MSMLVGNARPTLRGLVVSACLVCVAVVASLAVAPAAHAQAQVSQAVVDKYNPASEAFKKNDFAGAIKGAKEALAVAKTPYEKQICQTVIWRASTAAQNFPEAVESGEGLLALEGVPPATKLSIQKSLATIYPRVNHIDKAIAITKDYMKVTGGVPADWALLASFYSAQRDCPNGLAALDKALAGGKQADEEQLKQQSQCYYKDKNVDKRIVVNEELLKRFPKKDAYGQLLNIYQTDRKIDDNFALQELLRFGFEHDYLDSEPDFTKLADLALDVGANAEAQRVLEKGIQKKLVKNEGKAKQLLEQAKTKGAEDKTTIAQTDAEARAGKNGETDVRLAYRYFGMAQYDKAVEAIQRGQQPDHAARIKRPDDANMVLGIALLKLKKNADAAKAFTAAKGDPKMAPVARIWLNAT